MRLGKQMFTIRLVVSHPNQQMRMTVDQTRQQHCTADVDDSCIFWDDQLRSDGSNAITLDNHHGVTDKRSGFYVEQARGFNRDNRNRLRIDLRATDCGHKQCAEENEGSLGSYTLHHHRSA